MIEPSPGPPQPAKGPPTRQSIAGRLAWLEPIDPARHAPALYEASHAPPVDPALWEYMAYGPFADLDAFTAWLTRCAGSADPLFFAIGAQGHEAASGMAAFLNIRPPDGVIEVGHIWYGPALQRTTLATEAMYLMARHAFDELGYRRLEWKCDASNERSIRAARRLGFAYEGRFRQHMIIKGRNRDTAWFALLGRHWPWVRAAMERWLAPANFDPGGRQRSALAAAPLGDDDTPSI